MAVASGEKINTGATPLGQYHRAGARAFYLDGTYDREQWRAAYFQIGQRIPRLRYLGDRLLDALDALVLIDQLTLPPKLLDLVNQYRYLLGMNPIQTTSIRVAQEIVFRAQSTLLKPEVIRDLLQNKEETW